VLKAGFDLPPLMFREQEIEALVLGARIVQSWADPELANAATDVIAKVEAVIPDRLRDYMANTALLAPSHHYMEPISFEVADLRRALRNQLKVHFAYRNAHSEASERTVRPLCLAYFGPVWLLSAWCELRDDFRTFRLDRIDGFAVQADRFRQEPGKTLHDFLKRDQTWTRTSGPSPNA
jgi:predicted DNA-binding transcriptional regulator YafY